MTQVEIQPCCLLSFVIVTLRRQTIRVEALSATVRSIKFRSNYYINSVTTIPLSDTQA